MFFNVKTLIQIDCKNFILFILELIDYNYLLIDTLNNDALRFLYRLYAFYFLRKFNNVIKSIAKNVND